MPILSLWLRGDEVTSQRRSPKNARIEASSWATAMRELGHRSRHWRWGPEVRFGKAREQRILVCVGVESVCEGLLWCRGGCWQLADELLTQFGRSCLGAKVSTHT